MPINCIANYFTASAIPPHGLLFEKLNLGDGHRVRSAPAARSQRAGLNKTIFIEGRSQYFYSPFLQSSHSLMALVMRARSQRAGLNKTL